MYHYKISGLPNVWLADGYEWSDTAYGKAIAFSDPDALHEAIAQTLLNKGELTGKEFRFLRVELDLSQGELGGMFGRSDQAVALWEKGRGAPRWAQRILCGLYRERTGGAVKLFEVLQSDEGRRVAAGSPKRLVFEKPKRGAWRLMRPASSAAA